VAISPGHDRAIRIAVRSDRRLFRDTLTACLTAQPDFRVVGHAGDLDDLRVLCELQRPDVVLVDLGAGLGGGSGASPPADRCGPVRTARRCDPDWLAGTRMLGRLRDCVASSRVVVMYEQLSPAELAALWRLGVDTLVPCSHGLDALLVVLQRYVTGDRVDPARPGADDDGLTEQEREVITLVGAGHTVDRIAELLQVSASEVANTKRRIYHKLEVTSQSQAVARAAALGIVNWVRVPRSAIGPRRTDGAGQPGTVENSVVVLRGGPSPVRQQVAAALLAGGIPFVTDVLRVGADTAERDERNRVLLVLVDPAPSDWPAGRDAGLRVALVRSEVPRRAEVLEALLRGAVAVVTLDRLETDLVPALTLAMHGYLAVEGTAADALLDAVRTPGAAPAAGLPELTLRESDILRSIALGHTVRQTARVLGIAEKTVENTQARLFRKLGARNRTAALAAAHALGLLELVTRAPVPPVGVG
jgi:DNA-binding NarL/FixJ family response regulator